MIRATRYDDLYIHLLVELPQGWSWASGKEPSNLVTQISRASNTGGDDGVCKFAFPFELASPASFRSFAFFSPRLFAGLREGMKCRLFRSFLLAAKFPLVSGRFFLFFPWLVVLVHPKCSPCVSLRLVSLAISRARARALSLPPRTPPYLSLSRSLSGIFCHASRLSNFLVRSYYFRPDPLTLFVLTI